MNSALVRKDKFGNKYIIVLEETGADFSSSLRSDQPKSWANGLV